MTHVDHGVSLRPTTETDLDFVLELELRPENRGLIGIWNRSEHLDACKRADREHWIIACTIDGAALGYAITYDLRDAGFGVFLKRIAVSERAVGTGRQALRLLLDHAFEELGAEAMYLDVYDYNERARRLYETTGFSEPRLPEMERARFIALTNPLPANAILLRVTPQLRT